MNLKIALLATIIASPATAGTLAEHVGVYRAAAENSSFCPQDSTLTLTASDGEQAFSVEYRGAGTVNGLPVEGTNTYNLNVASELPVMPIPHYGRIVLKNQKVIAQDKSKFSLFWQDKETLFGLAERNSITAYFTLVPCVFER
jgi:hypothetical protein